MESNRNSLIFAAVVGLFIGLALVLNGCAARLGVTGVNVGVEVDPGKLAPLVR